MSSASAPAHLAHHDPVGPHAQRVAHELRGSSPRRAPPGWRGRASSRTTWRWRSRSSAASSIVTIRSLVRDRARQRVRASWSCPSPCRRRRGPTRARAHARGRGTRPAAAGSVPFATRSSSEKPVPAEAPDREARARQRERRDHHVHARAVGQPRVAQRRRLVHAPAQRRQDALDRVHQLGVAVERDAGRARSARAARRRPRPARSPSPRPRAGSASSGSSGPSPVASRSTRSAERVAGGIGQRRGLTLHERAHLGLEPVRKRPRAASVGARGLDQRSCGGPPPARPGRACPSKGRAAGVRPAHKSPARAMAIIGVGSVIVELHLREGPLPPETRGRWRCPRPARAQRPCSA